MPSIDLSEFKTKSALDTPRLTKRLNINKAEDAGLLHRSIKTASDVTQGFEDLSTAGQDDIISFIARDELGAGSPVERHSLLNKPVPEPTPKKFEVAKLDQPAISQSHGVNLVSNKVIDRLGVGSKDNLLNFAELVMHVESDGRGTAKNPNSSAKGHFQYIDASVKPAINRIKRFFKDKTPKWLQNLEEHRDVAKLTATQATQLFIADISEKKGTDSLLRKVVEGDVGAMKELYNKYHHTDPDQATIKRFDKIASKYV